MLSQYIMQPLPLLKDMYTHPPLNISILETVALTAFPTSATSIFGKSARYEAAVPRNTMTDSGGFVKVPNDEEEERMRKAAEESQRKREEARKKREMEEAMKKAGEDSQRRRREGGATA